MVLLLFRRHVHHDDNHDYTLRGAGGNDDVRIHDSDCNDAHPVLQPRKRKGRKLSL